MHAEKSAHSWMRELARVRAQAAKLRTAGAAKGGETLALVDDALDLLDRLRLECAGLQQRCTELERRLAMRIDGTRRLFDTLPQAIVTTDPTGVILDANRAACLLLGRSRPKLTSDLLLYFVEDREAFSRLIRELPQSTGPLNARARFRPTDRAPFEATVTAVRDPHADPAAWLWLLQRTT